MSAQIPNFIIIDDSRLDCFIAEKIIQNSGTYSSVKSYMEATEAYEAIKNGLIGDDSIITIIILDIQMPVMNGFQFVEVFEQLPKEIQSKFAIFLFSSSINENDKNRLENYPSIIRFYSKPISKDTVAQMIEQV
ncbi:response regulator [Daejeonella sp.]|uniref:response regulator n=1 Tax=Daejeonella sp. TaxID=2805397 RepID=UPI00271EB0C1|nr:response regulator [Daejeonella sp.]MDO8994617.1 response regulator [Daejeonella sp.]MDP2413914.1 response regulator [Daejeonella sp.]